MSELVINCRLASTRAWKSVQEFVWEEKVLWSDVREKVAKVVGVSLKDCNLLAEHEDRPGTPLQDDDVMNNCSLILRRVPLLEQPVGTEESRKRKTPDTETSPETMQKRRQQPLYQYICFSCGQQGDHYASACPKRAEPHFRPLYKRTLPTGAPAEKFRLAETDNERKRAYFTHNRQFVIPLSKDSIYYIE